MNQNDERFTEFERALTLLINQYSMENGSDTPDFILSRYLVDCLKAYNKTRKSTKQWKEMPEDFLDIGTNDG